MEKLNRLGWAEGIAISSFGVRVGIRVNDPAVLARIADRLPPGWKPAASQTVERMYSLIIGGPGASPNIRRLNLLYSNHVRLARERKEELVYNALETDLQLYVAEMARRRVFVHAGVVGWQGKAIVIPGKTFTGKSTLVAELVRAGATYYSDEYAVFDSRGRVHPYPRPLAIREKQFDKPQKISLESLGASIGTKPLPVGVVLVSEYKEGARWRPRKISAGQGALALLANAVAARREPEKLMAILSQVVASATILKSSRGEAKEVVASTLQTVVLPGNGTALRRRRENTQDASSPAQ